MMKPIAISKLRYIILYTIFCYFFPLVYNNHKIKFRFRVANLIYLFFFLFCWFLGEVICENLPTDICSFSIASSGKRCLLENYAAKDGKVEYQCRTSEVVVERMAEYIETDECVSACGVDRNSVGISSDSLLEPQSTAKICSPCCYQNCPNIVDLYFNLAAGEGKLKYIFVHFFFTFLHFFQTFQYTFSTSSSLSSF